MKINMRLFSIIASVSVFLILMFFSLVEFSLIPFVKIDKDWLGFWGGVVGGLIGVLGTFSLTAFTINYSDRQKVYGEYSELLKEVQRFGKSVQKDIIDNYQNAVVLQKIVYECDQLDISFGQRYDSILRKSGSIFSMPKFKYYTEVSNNLFMVRYCAEQLQLKMSLTTQNKNINVANNKERIDNALIALNRSISEQLNKYD
ncbi:UNVERIFIED_ORG: hypothetical protein ABIC58_000251 [Leuconostoc holzapfelii]